jgi:uncharacterized protein YbaP (TraB family)
MEVTRRFLLIIIMLVPQVLSANSGEGSVPDGIMWRISGNGLERPSYVLGTVHTLHRDIIRHIPEITLYLDSVEALALESDILKTDWQPDMEKIRASIPDEASDFVGRMSKDFSQKGKKNPYNKYLSKEQRDSLDAMMDYLMGDMSYKNLNPGITFFLLYHSFMEKRRETQEHLGYDTQAGSRSLDAELEKLFLQRNEKLRMSSEGDTLQVLGLDSVRMFQYAAENALLFPDYRMTSADMAQSIYERVTGLTKRIEQIEMEDSLYRKGKGYDILQSQSLYYDTKANDVFKVEERNRYWMSKLPAIIEEGPAFIAVGLSHVLPTQWSEGILSELMKLGYDVTPIH